MPVGLSDDFITTDFLAKSREALDTLGFVSDEHEFAPYKDEIVKHRAEIQAALNRQGSSVELQEGFLPHHRLAGFAHFLYAAGRYPDEAGAREAVSAWLDGLYESE